MSRTGYWEALLDLLFPKKRTCALCGQPQIRQEEVVCSLCTAQVRAGEPPFCTFCGRERERGGVCSDCRRAHERFFHRAFSYGPYKGQLKALVLHVKKSCGEEVVPLLVSYLEEAWAAHLFSCGIDLLVPVPITADKRKVRGFNQAERLASGLSRRIALPVCQALAWQGTSRHQVGLTRDQRLSNDSRSLSLTPAAATLAGRTVCLLDDVYTTGTTANLCAKKLLEAGARTVFVLTVAR